MTPSPSHAASTPPTSAERQGQERQDRQARAAERGVQQEEDGDRGDDANRNSRSLLRGLPLGVLAEQLGVVLRAGSRSASSARPRRRRRPTPRSRPRTLAPTSMRRDSVLVVDVRSASAATWTSATSPSRTLPPAACRSAGRGCRSGSAAPRARSRRPRRRPCRLEDVADLLARDQRGRRAADVARLEPVPLRRGEVDLDLDLGHVDLQLLDVQVDDAVDRRASAASTSVGLGSRGRPDRGPKMRTTIASLEPVRTSLMRSFR